MLQLKEKCIYDVKVIVQNITKGARNELEKLRAIWVWLCHNIGACSRNIQMIPQHARDPLLLKRNVWGGFCCFLFSAYDVKGYLGQTERLTDPEEVIAAGRGVCCGYSNLCMDMCR